VRRRFALLAGLLAVTAALPAPALAGAAVKGQEQVLEVFCDGADDDAAASVFLFDDGASLAGDVFAIVDGGSTALLTDPSTPPDIAGDGLDRVMTVALIDELENPAGTAVVEFDLIAGAPEPVDERFRDGNAWVDIEGTRAPLEGTALVSLPNDVTVTTTCSGEVRELTVFMTDPAARIRQSDGVVMECDLVGPDGALTLVAEVSADGDFAFASGAADIHGLAMVGIEGSATLDGADLIIDAFVYDPFEGETLGSLGGALGLTATGDTFRWKLPYSNGPIFVSGEYLAVSGTLTAQLDVDGSAVEASWDADACIAADQHVKDQLLPMQGPKPKGRPLPNDGPDGALDLELGVTSRQMTRTTVPESEASTLDCLGVDMAHTVWYRVTATSDGPLTIDTRGSDFDTVVAVYAADDLTSPLGCNDDVNHPPLNRTIEAILEFDAEAGATYLVQAGSFPGPVQQYGKLVLVVD
jgi:hypothetical protein